jgi:hypothetical protein
MWLTTERLFRLDIMQTTLDARLHTWPPGMIFSSFFPVDNRLSRCVPTNDQGFMIRA